MTEAIPTPIFRVRELTVTYRGHRLQTPFTESLDTPGAVAKLAAEILRDSAVETILVLHLNVRHRVIGVHRVAGTLDAVAVSVADVCRAALLTNAPCLVLAHNHLSGEPNPSDSDRLFVERLHQSALLLGLQLLDAVIVIDPAEGHAYYSFSEDGLL